MSGAPAFWYPGLGGAWGSHRTSVRTINLRPWESGPGHSPKKFFGYAASQTALEEQLSALVVGHGNLLMGYGLGGTDGTISLPFERSTFNF